MINSDPVAFSGLSSIFATNYDKIPLYPKRKFFFWRILVSLLIILLVFLSWPKQGSLEVSLSPANLLELTNQDRDKFGLDPLKMNTRLTRAAYAKAEHMLRNAYFAHVSPQGVEPWNFIKEQNFAYAFAGENLAINYTSSYELEHDFLGSPSHRSNILSPNFTETGIAVVEGEIRGEPVILTVQLFATPAFESISLSQ